MFLTSHLMIAFILYKVLHLDANVWLFLFFSILPDASWPFYNNHRKESWFHTVLTFSWTLFFYPYWIAVLSHFVADFFFGGIKLTPWSKKRIGIISRKGKPISKKYSVIERIRKHLVTKYFNHPLYALLEIVLLIVTIVLVII